MDARNYNATDTLRDGTPIVIRALRPGDTQELLEGLGRMSRDSIVRRFFSVRKEFTAAEIDYFVNVDFVSHVALVATIDSGDGPGIVAAARYIVGAPGVAEVAFAVDDALQGRGIGKRMMKHIVLLARAAGLVELRAEVLAENQPMLRVFRGSGLDVATHREDGVIHVRMPLGPQPAASAAATRENA